MFCCSNCFTHIFLKDFIQSSSKKKGKCSFCNHRITQPLYKPALLVDLFQPLFDLYTETVDGRPLVELLQLDWNVFSKNIDKNKRAQLISKIADISNLSSKKFSSTLVQNQEYLTTWDAFTNELKYGNRFFPNKIDITQLSELLNYLIMPKKQNPKHVFRARRNYHSKTLSISEMGKPPVDESADGRANPKGISYFYGSSDEKTAIAEARPYKSEIVCVAKYKIKTTPSLIDLRDPKSTISPFGLDDDSLSLLYKEHMPILEHLSNSNSKSSMI